MLNKKKENVSTVMLLPILRLDKKLSSRFYNLGFKGTYLYCESLDKTYKFNPIYLLFEPDQLNAEFNDFLKGLSNNIHFIETHSVGIRKVVLVFKIPDLFKADFKLFLEGKYSKLTDAYKRCFALEKPVKNDRGDIKRDVTGAMQMEKTNYFHIFNKTQKLRDLYKSKLGLDFELSEDLELFDIINKDKETLKEIIL